MRFVVDEMPHSAECDCPFAEWKPLPPICEEIGYYVCKNDKKRCDRDETECRWMVQMPKPIMEEGNKIESE